MFPALFFPVRIDTSVRSDGEYNIKASVTNISEGQPLIASDITIWGVPADHQGPGPFEEIYGTSYGGPLQGAPRIPFMTNPSVCDGRPLVTTFDAVPWTPQANPVAPATAESPALTGCDKQTFGAGIGVKPTSSKASESSGFSIRLTVPQNQSPDGVATPPLKDAVVTMPAGVALSPSAADGLGACSDAQLNLHSIEPEQCPDSSKIGTAELTTPLLADPLKGSLYLGTQLSNDPRSGKMYRLFLVLAGSGVRIKLEGSVKADPVTGQLVTSFDENPQLPFEELQLTFNSGPRAALTTPSTCGTYAAEAELTPWSGATVDTTSSFTIDQNCQAASQFAPSMEAGVQNPVAGKSSTFVLNLNRPDGQQNVRDLSVVLPKGQLAKLAGVGVCGDADALTGNCPAASQVGTTTVAIGAGSNPIYVPQPGKSPTAVYLAGPYKGAPYSLVVKVPAQAGPFDLGTVAVRNALHIDPTTTQVTVSSDPLPQVLGGIPISYRSVDVSVDRPEFIQNPTNCEPTSVDSTITSAQGAVAHPSSRYQMADCGNLGLAPKLALKFSGAPTRRGGHPKLTATLTTKSADANLRQVQVTLPKTEYLENAHIRTVCTRVQYAANQCPQKSIYGYARAWTPLLDKPLEGPVYLRSSSHKLPDLVASLDGQIHVDLDGRISSSHSRIRNTFETVPDAPVSKFVLTMQGGGKGLLVNNTNLCKAKPRANVEFDGQNGKLHDTEPLVSVGGCGKGGKKK
jgi:hypothetical protein